MTQQPPGPVRSPLRRTWPLFSALILILLVALGSACTREGRAAVTSFVFLPDMMTELPVRPVTWFTADPIVERVMLPYGDGGYLPADVYRPSDDKPHAALILSPGAPPLEPDDSRLVRLGGDIARAGLVMLVPFSPDLDREVIYPREVEGLVAAFEYLERQQYVKPDKIGYIGVSVGAPLALMAASDDRIAADVSFVVSFGGYYDALDLFRSVLTGVISYDGKEESWDPRNHTEDVVAEQVIERLESARDRDILTRLLVDGKEEARSELGRLSADGEAAYDFLTNRDPARFDELLARLPEEVVADLRALSLSGGRLDGLRAEMFILHDKSDRYIPYVESRRLRDALQGQVKVHFTEVNIFEHVEPSADRGASLLLVDGAKLYFHLYQILLHFT